MAIYVNLTAHEIILRSYQDNGGDKVIPPEGDVLRIAAEGKRLSYTTDGIPIMALRPADGERTKALELIRTKLRQYRRPSDCCYLLVSGKALDTLAPSLPDDLRLWVLAPDTNEESAIRDEQGNIRAVRALRKGLVR